MTAVGGSKNVEVLVAGRDDILPAFAENNIALFLGCDDHFFAHALTVVASVMAHASPSRNYDILIVQDAVAPEKLACATEWARRFANARLRFVDVGEMMDRVGRDGFHVTPSVSTGQLLPALRSGYLRTI